VWTYRGKKTFKFYEYTSSSFPLSHPPADPSCILFFVKFLQEQTADFQQELNNLKQLYEKLQCPILTIHTFCDQTNFPISFVEFAKSGEQSEDINEKDLACELYKRWRNQRDAKINQELGCTISSVCCAFSFHSGKSRYIPSFYFHSHKDTTLPDGNNMNELLIKRICTVLSTRNFDYEQGSLKTILKFTTIYYALQ